MKAKPNKGRNVWKALIALFLASWFVSTPNTTTTFASNSFVPFDDMRTDMLDIADLYASYQWYATETNLLHYDITNPSLPDRYPSGRFEANGIFYPNPNNPLEALSDPRNYQWSLNRLLEPNSNQPKGFGSPEKTLNRGFMHTAPVDTPSWVSTTQINTGIPYAWGRSTVVRDLLLNLPMKGLACFSFCVQQK